ncbi:dachshund homolog 1-like isoform X1 [Dermacentor andersoni]|uniref:dachshund homolog 1-like isoform X1 n=1 Tax=Dermacentor andersoni TaxID=34620 RepID=UPI0021555AB3|nr:dachshund homolog 2-like isoform X1 [Dermacentor andersoni]
MASTDAASLLPENLSLGGGHPAQGSSYLGGDSRGSSPCGPDLPPPLPPAFNAAALCDQFCSVINGFRGGLDPLSSAAAAAARLKSPSRSVAADATDCRLIEYRGEKVAAFAYRGEYLLCLPQAFELFLKHLVGGLHTVYTKLKRLGISPIVCNVEQVRVLRGLGAIQPGVNRCKLLSCKDFDSLYKDCTTARQQTGEGRRASLPGRPPKRASLVGLGGRSGYPPLLKPGGEMDYDAAIKSENVRCAEEAELNIPAVLFKMWSQGARPAVPSDKMSASSAAAAYQAALGVSSMEQQALGMLGLSAHGAAHPSATAAAAAAAAYQRHLLAGGLALPLAAAGMVQLGRPVSGHEKLRQQQHQQQQQQQQQQHQQQQQQQALAHGLDLCSPRNSDEYGEKEKMRGTDPNRRSMSPGWPPGEHDLGSALNLSQSGGMPPRDRDSADGHQRARDDDEMQAESDYADDREQGDLSGEDSEASLSSSGGGGMKRSSSQDGEAQLFMERAGLLAARGMGSVETLLQNILGLLKVAEENARQQEQQVHMERAELKVEILRERELREGLEKKLQEEQTKRVFYQKRLRREKRCRRQVQDQLEGEVKKRARCEEALRSTLVESQQTPKETLQDEIKSEDTIAMESDNSVKSR